MQFGEESRVGRSEAAAKARMKERLPLLKGEVPSCTGQQERVLLGQDPHPSKAAPCQDANLRAPEERMQLKGFPTQRQLPRSTG